MSQPRESLVDLADRAGPPPIGVDLTTWLIAEVPAARLTKAAKWVVPSYAALEEDQRRGGDLIKYLEETPLPEKSLGEDILLTQQRLAGPKRRLATVACALTFFTSMGAFTEYAKQGIEPITDQPNSPAESKKPIDWDGDALAGSIAGLAGGFLAYFIALGQSNRLAVKPARKIVRKTQFEIN
jgi:hypothetical protein